MNTILDILSDAATSAIGPFAAIYALAAIGLNLHFGYTGLLNFGQVGFMLVGAYGVAISVAEFDLPVFVGVLVGIACATVLALILGVPTLRLRGDYLAITTIASAEVLRYLYRWEAVEGLTGGVFGIRGYSQDFYALSPFSSGLNLGPLSFTARNLWVMTVGWSLVVLVSFLVYLLVRSPWGRVLKSVREDELAARSLGKNVYAYKMQSLILGGVIGSVAGALFAFQLTAMTPDVFMPAITFYLWTIVILGGASTILGPILGSVIFWFLLEFLNGIVRDVVPDSIISGAAEGPMRFVFVGVILVLLMVFRPAGILGDPKEIRLDVR